MRLQPAIFRQLSTCRRLRPKHAGGNAAACFCARASRTGPTSPPRIICFANSRAATCSRTTTSAPVSSVSAQGSNLSATGSSLSAQQTGFNIEINLASDVLFDFDKADLKPEADPELQKATEVIREKGKGLILITGHTDSKGSKAYNKKLSLARTEAVKQWFEKHGLHYDYQTDGKGAADPIAPNANENGSDNPEGRAKNRRVEIVINKTKQLGE